MVAAFNAEGKHVVIHLAVPAPTEAKGLHCGVAVASQWELPISELQLPKEVRLPARERFQLVAWAGLFPKGVVGEFIWRRGLALLTRMPPTSPKSQRCCVRMVNLLCFPE